MPTETIEDPRHPKDEPLVPRPGARPWGPDGELVNPPREGDDQARCWNLLFGSAHGAGIQCLLFNGHEGEHQHGLIGSELAEVQRRAADRRLISWYALSTLDGLLEGDALDEVWELLVRDPEVGKPLLERYGVVLGRDGERLYVRRVPAKEA